ISTAQWMRAESNAERAEANTEQLAQQLYTSDMRVIQHLDEAGDVQSMGKLLERHEPIGRTDRRGFEWAGFWRRYQRAQPIRTLRDSVESMSATPNGQTVALLMRVHDHGIDKDQVIFWDAATDQERGIFVEPRGTFNSPMALSPNGRIFATGSS